MFKGPNIDFKISPKATPSAGPLLKLTQVKLGLSKAVSAVLKF
jgi:hypothetical protein